MENFDILIYAALTVFLISRLWAVLGRRGEGEQDRSPRPNPFAKNEQQADEEDVMVLEGRARPVEKPSVLTQAGHAPASLAGAIDQIRAADPSFHEKQFLDGAKIAFSKIVTSFAAGDLSSVERFMGPSVLSPFTRALEARKAKGQTLENQIERIVAADIVAAKMEDTAAFLSVEFVSYQVNVLRDSAGQILDGAPGRAEEVRDVWVFRRDVRSPDPNWQLVETRS